MSIYIYIRGEMACGCIRHPYQFMISLSFNRFYHQQMVFKVNINENSVVFHFLMGYERNMCHGIYNRLLDETGCDLPLLVDDQNP